MLRSLLSRPLFGDPMVQTRAAVRVITMCVKPDLKGMVHAHAHSVFVHARVFAVLRLQVQMDKGPTAAFRLHVLT